MYDLDTQLSIQLSISPLLPPTSSPPAQTLGSHSEMVRRFRTSPMLKSDDSSPAASESGAVGVHSPIPATLSANFSNYPSDHAECRTHVLDLKSPRRQGGKSERVK
jgi:hypothetical protein